MNQKRNISLELSEEEKLLYSYSQGITLKLLEGMKEKYAGDMESETNAEDTRAAELGEGLGMMGMPGSTELDELPSLMRS